MDRRRTVWPFAVGALAFIALLALVGGVGMQAAWSQGYMAGRLSTGAEGDAPLPYLVGYGQPLGQLMLPWLVGILLVALVLAVFGMVLRFLVWRHWQATGGPEWREAWARHGWHHGPPSPPWGHERPEVPREQAEPKAPAAESEG